MKIVTLAELTAAMRDRGSNSALFDAYADELYRRYEMTPHDDRAHDIYPLHTDDGRMFVNFWSRIAIGDYDGARAYGDVDPSWPTYVGCGLTGVVEL